LAGKIKAIKSAQSIEATPQRARQKHSTAEEPVARIRRRAGATPASAPGIDRDATAAEAGGTAPSIVKENSPAMTFQERITMERQRKDDGPSPP